MAQTPVIQAVVNGGSFRNNLSPGVTAAIFGANLGPFVAVQGAAPNLVVTVNGGTARVTFSSAQQVFIQIPFSVSVGPATVVVQYEGRSSASFPIQLDAFSPALYTSLPNGGGGIVFLKANGSVGPNSPANPGERISVFATGLGPVSPSAQVPVTLNQPAVTIAGAPAAVLLSAYLSSAAYYQVDLLVPSGLPTGNYPIVLSIGGFSSPPGALPVASTGLGVSQSGFTFRATQGGGTPPPSPFRISNGTPTPFNYSLTTSTLPAGGTWLAISNSSGVAPPGTVGATETIRVNPAGLPPGDYYGRVQVSAPSVNNSPQSLSIVLSVSQPTVNAVPAVQPSGLLFVQVANSAVPASQSIRITSAGNRSSAFTVTGSAQGPIQWFNFTPAAGNVAPNTPVDVNVSIVPGLAVGVYRGTLSLQFPQDNAVAAVDLLLVVTPGLNSDAPPRAIFTETLRPANSCTPTRLLLVFAGLGSGFRTPVAWPASLAVKVADDCGTPLTAGSVVATFSNGDPPLSLQSLGDGQWEATWSPERSRDSVVITATAANPALNIQGTAEIGGSAQENPDVPVLSGIVNAGSFASTASPSPGELVSIFGASLADGFEDVQAFPLPTTLKGASLFISGKELPIKFTSGGQVNAQIPYDIVPGSTPQLIVQRGNRLSVPRSVGIAAAEPSVFTVDATGRGQGHVYKFVAGQQILADASSPAKAGDVLVIYGTGLGAVTPAVAAGTAVPFDTVRRTSAAVTVTIGGVNAPVAFAGLTPGFTGLYQVNATVPPGVAPGKQVPLIISVAGLPGPAVTMALE